MTLRRTFTTLSIILTTIFAGTGCSENQVFNESALIPTPVEINRNSDKTIRINGIVEILDSTFKIPQHGYSLEIVDHKAILKASENQGLAHARATLAQLAGVKPEEMSEDKAFKGARIPDVTIIDYPAFPVRGFMHDTGRNFREIETLKKELDLFAFYKLNVFHWHLTDNPAWRIECRAYPQLNDPQFQRQGRDEGKFYTYDQIRDVISYAKNRGIMVIPEIDMPGHSQYFNKTFGFGMATPEGMKITDKLMKR